MASIVSASVNGRVLLTKTNKRTMKVENGVLNGQARLMTQVGMGRRGGLAMRVSAAASSGLESEGALMGQPSSLTSKEIMVVPTTGMAKGLGSSGCATMQRSKISFKQSVQQSVPNMRLRKQLLLFLTLNKI